MIKIRSQRTLKKVKDLTLQPIAIVPVYIYELVNSTTIRYTVPTSTMHFIAM